MNRYPLVTRMAGVRFPVRELAICDTFSHSFILHAIQVSTTYRKPLLYAYTIFQNCKTDQEYMCSCKLGAYLANLMWPYSSHNLELSITWHCCHFTCLKQFPVSLSVCVMASSYTNAHCRCCGRVSSLVSSTRLWHSLYHGSRLSLPTISFVACFPSPL